VIADIAFAFSLWGVCWVSKVRKEVEKKGYTQCDVMWRALAHQLCCADVLQDAGEMCGRNMIFKSASVSPELSIILKS
jgi:hypothetical protein